jgi:hypothetical protein
MPGAKRPPTDGEPPAEPKPRDLVLSGWVSPPDALAGKPAILDVPAGEGRVIFFSFNPLHRYLNHSDFRLLFNTSCTGTTCLEERPACSLRRRRVMTDHPADEATAERAGEHAFEEAAAAAPTGEPGSGGSAEGATPDEPPRKSAAGQVAAGILASRRLRLRPRGSSYAHFFGVSAHADVLARRASRSPTSCRTSSARARMSAGVHPDLLPDDRTRGGARRPAGSPAPSSGC